MTEEQVQGTLEKAVILSAAKRSRRTRVSTLSRAERLRAPSMRLLSAASVGNTKALFAILGFAAVALSLTACRSHDFSQYPPNYREYAYVTNGGSGTVSVLDVVNVRLDRELAVGQNPVAVAASPTRNEVYVVNSGAENALGSVSVINAETNTVSHGSDKAGPLAGIPYDGVDPAYADLYHDADCARYSSGEFEWNDNGIPDAWKRHYLDRMTDLIDKYHPDLLYTDGHLPFEDTGLKMVAHLYNVSASLHGGVNEAVYNSKEALDCAVGTCALDHERGVADGIAPNPWQTDTCIGQWHYKRGQQYKSAKKVIDLLTDIVSKNGNLLLNFPLPNSGELDFEEKVTLDGVTKWMEVNSEGIYSTRPWKIYGEGPSTATKLVTGNFNEDKQKDLISEDIRFTAKGGSVYAFVMGWPAKEAVVKALGLPSDQAPGNIRNVELLGYNGKLEWKQDEASLRVKMPPEKLSDIGITFKVDLA